MKTQEFFDKYNGQGIDFDGAYGFQCVDLYDQYCKEVVEAPIILVNGAKNIWENYPTEQFERIFNTPEAVPQLGDVVIWNTGRYGHVAVFNEGDVNRFSSFDQNFPVGSKCHFQEHDYSGVIGWLHPKAQEQMAVITQKELDEMRKRRDELFDQLKEEVEKNNELTRQLQDEQAKSQALREANDTLTKTDADLGVQLLDAQHEANAYKAVIDEVKQIVGLSAQASVKELLIALANLTKPQDDIIKDREKLLKLIFEELTYKRVPSWVNSWKERLKRWLHVA